MRITYYICNATIIKMDVSGLLCVYLCYRRIYFSFESFISMYVFHPNYKSVSNFYCINTSTYKKNCDAVCCSPFVVILPPFYTAKNWN